MSLVLRLISPASSKLRAFLAALALWIPAAQAQEAAPQALEAPAIHAVPGPQEVVTPRGLTVWLKQEPSQPAVALHAQFRGGGMVDAPGRRGAAFLIGGLLEEGAGDLDAQAFQDARDDLGARIRYMTQSEDLSIDFWAPSENLAEALELLRLSLAEPRFDPDALALVKAQSVAFIRYQNADPLNLGELTFFERFFPDDPYSEDYRGEVSDYAGLTREVCWRSCRGSWTATG